jgi:cytochrome c-type biogenesis protein CcmH/NrfG
VRLSRLASVALASLDFSGAEKLYRAAVQLDGGLGEAWLGLAVLYTERGDARATVDAARAALRCPLTLPQKTFLRDLEALVAPYATDR